MLLLSSTDLAIRRATKLGTLCVKEEKGRFGAYWSISDDHGLIEVANTAQEAEARVDQNRSN